MKTFHSYLAESTKEFSFRVKSLVEIDDVFLDKMERGLRKYNVIDVSAVKRTAAQKNPMDFPHVDGLSEVYMVDIILGVPASSLVLVQDIRNQIPMPESQIVVRGKDEAVELVNTAEKAAHDMAKEAKGRGLTPAALLNDSEYNEAVDTEVQTGNDYTERFLGYLSQIAANREEITFDGTEIKKTPRFAWLKKEEAEDFNASIKDAPKVAKSKTGKKAVAPSDVHHTGVNLDSDKEFKALYVDDKGVKKVVSRTTKQVRKD
jgi:hypothetical protein